VLCEDASERLNVISGCIPQTGWVAGAIAGIRAGSRQELDWEWDNFIGDVYEAAEELGGIEVAEPGACLVDSDGHACSCYDTLGGYISTAGGVCSEGLLVRLPSARLECVAGLLPGFMLARAKGGLLIPRYELTSFLNLVPVRGPIVDKLAEEGMM